MTPDDHETSRDDPPLRPAALQAGPWREPPPPTSARWLALVPITATLLVFLLMWPRETPPEEIPLPQIDGAALRSINEADAERAREARTSRLPGDVLAVGTALRSINKAITAGDTEAVAPARATLEDALRGVGTRDPKQGIEGLKALRAVHLEGFLAEVERFESTGQPSSELLELGGDFIERMREAGWVQGRTVILDDAQRRAAFKLVWTAMVGGGRAPELGLAVDEQRALYTLYLARPHVPDGQRLSFEAMRRGAASDSECKTVASKEQLATELWRAEKIKKLGALDPAYPTGYALGVAYYRAGRYDLSMNAFRVWMDQHPDGPLAIRARNHWIAAVRANGPG